MTYKFLLWILVLVVLVSPVLAHNYTPLHYYPLNDTLDYGRATTSNLDGTLPSFVVGLVGNASDFETSSSQYLRNGSGLNNQSIIETIELWAKPEQSVNYQQLISLGDAATNYNFDMRADNGGKIQVRLRSGGSVIYTLTSSTDFTVGNWVHIVYVCEDSGVKLYINGASTPEDTDGSSLCPTTGNYADFVLGARANGGQNAFFDGIIDNVAFFEENYNTSDVSYAYNGGSGRDYLAAEVEGVSGNVNLLTPLADATVNTDPVNFTYNVSIVPEEAEEGGGGGGGTYAPDFDIVALYANSEANEVFKNDGTGSFTSYETASETDSSYAGVAGDLDDDGDLDYIAGTHGGVNRIYKNNGSGSFSLYESSIESDNTYSLAIGDIDGDGDLDYIAGNGGWDGNQVNRIYKNNGSGSFTLYDSSSESEKTLGVAVADIDDDGDLDYIAANYQGADRIYKNDGTGNFSSHETTSNTASTKDIEFADLDDDGDIDFIAGKYGNQDIVYKNDGTGSFSLHQTIAAHKDGDDNGAVTLGDIDGDGDVDYIEGNDGWQDRVLKNDGTGTFTTHQYPADYPTTQGAALADIDDDGDLDYITAAGFGGRYHYTNNGSGTFTSDGGNGFDTAYDVLLIDIDGDGSATETDCSDGIDNDKDGWLDAQDSDCATTPSTPTNTSQYYGNPNMYISYLNDFTADIGQADNTDGELTSGGYCGQGVYLSGNDYALTHPAINKSSFTLAGWFKFNDTIDSDIGLFGNLGINDNAGDIQTWIDNDGASDHLAFARYSTGYDVNEYTGHVIQPNSWYHIALTFNQSGNNKYEVYLNGTQVIERSNTLIVPTNTMSFFGIGVKQGKGIADNIYYFNNSLTASQISDLSDMGCVGLTTELYINVSGTWQSVASDISLENNQTGNFSYSLEQGTYLWGIKATLDGVDYWSTNHTLRVDLEDPNIEVLNFVDEQVYLNEYANVTGTIQINDSINVFSANISVNGDTLYYNNNLNTTAFEYNFSLNPSNYSFGKNNITIRAADGHTAKQLRKDWRINDGLFNNLLKYDIRDKKQVEIEVYQKGKPFFDRWETQRLKDRYVETYKPSTPATSYTFVVESDNYIHIVDDVSGKGAYGGRWLIVDEYWKDFVVKDQPNAKTSFKRINDNMVEVTVSNLKRVEELEFQSTGELNVVSHTYYFYVGNATTLYEPTARGGYTQNYTLVFDYGTTASLVSAPSATLELNSTNYTVSANTYSNTSSTFIKSITHPSYESEVNISHKWYVNIPGLTVTTLETGLNNQSAFNINVGICNTSLEYPIVNYSYVDEQTDNSINATHVYDIKIYDGSTYFNQTGSFEEVFNGQFCTNLDPSLQNYTWTSWGSNTISSDGYVTRVVDIDAILPQTLANNPITQISYALILTNSSSTVNYNWRTSSYQTVDGTMRVFECNDDGSKTLIESTPVVNGLATANIELLTQAYSYDIIIDDVLYQNTQSWGRCHVESNTEINLEIDLTEQEESLDLVGLLGSKCVLERVSNNTVTMSWTPSTTNTEYVSGCIVAHRGTFTGRVEVYNNCTTESDGYERTVSIPSNGNDYVVSAYLEQNSITAQCLQSVSFTGEDTGSAGYGVDGLIATSFLVISLALIFAGSGGLMIFGAIVGLIVSFVLGLNSISWFALAPLIIFLVFIAWIGRYTRRQG